MLYAKLQFSLLNLFNLCVQDTLHGTEDIVSADGVSQYPNKRLSENNNLMFYDRLIKSSAKEVSKLLGHYKQVDNTDVEPNIIAEALMRFGIVVAGKQGNYVEYNILMPNGFNEQLIDVLDDEIKELLVACAVKEWYKKKGRSLYREYELAALDHAKKQESVKKLLNYREYYINELGNKVKGRRIHTYL